MCTIVSHSTLSLFSALQENSVHKSKISSRETYPSPPSLSFHFIFCQSQKERKLKKRNTRPATVLIMRSTSRWGPRRSAERRRKSERGRFPYQPSPSPSLIPITCNSSWRHLQSTGIWTRGDSADSPDPTCPLQGCGAVRVGLTGTFPTFLSARYFYFLLYSSLVEMNVFMWRILVGS